MEEKKQTPSKFDPKDVEENKAIACLSYVGILFLIPMLAKKESKFAQDHAKQGLALFIADVVVSLIAWIPFVGWILGLGALTISVIAIIQTLQGKFWEIPVLYNLSRKFNF